MISILKPYIKYSLDAHYTNYRITRLVLKFSLKRQCEKDLSYNLRSCLITLFITEPPCVETRIYKNHRI